MLAATPIDPDLLRQELQAVVRVLATKSTSPEVKAIVTGAEPGSLRRRMSPGPTRWISRPLLNGAGARGGRTFASGNLAYIVAAWFARVATMADILRPVSTTVRGRRLIVAHTGASRAAGPPRGRSRSGQSRRPHC